MSHMRTGWFRAHAAIRKDMQDVKRMVSAYINQLEAGAPLTPDQTKAGKTFWDVFYHFLHHHHDNEEKVAFPVIAKKAEIPNRMTDDHLYLVASLDKCADLLDKALTSPEMGGSLKLLSEFKPMFEKLENDMLEHLAEEERVMMPILRRVVSPAEYKKQVVGPIVRSMGKMDNGDFFDKFESAEDRKGFFKQEGIPFFIGWYLNHCHRSYVKAVVDPFKKAVGEAETYRPPALAA